MDEPCANEKTQKSNREEERRRKRQALLNAKEDSGPVEHHPHEEHEREQITQAGINRPRICRWIKRKAQKANLAEWVMVGVAAIAAAATITYAIVAYCQWQAMSGQLCVMQKTLKLTRNQVEDASGAIVYAHTPFGFMSPTNIYINLSNSGRTRASDVHAILDITFLSVPAAEPIGKTIRRRLDIDSIGQFNPSDPINGNNRYQWQVYYAISDKQAREISQGRIAMKADLRLSYNDGFRVVHNRACYVRLQFSIKTPYFSAQSGGDSECSDLPNSIPQFYKVVRKVQHQAAVAAQRHKQN